MSVCDRLSQGCSAFQWNLVEPVWACPYYSINDFENYDNKILIIVTVITLLTARQLYTYYKELVAIRRLPSRKTIDSGKSWTRKFHIPAPPCYPVNHRWANGVMKFPSWKIVWSVSDQDTVASAARIWHNWPTLSLPWMLLDAWIEQGLYRSSNPSCLYLISFWLIIRLTLKWNNVHLNTLRFRELRGVDKWDF